MMELGSRPLADLYADLTTVLADAALCRQALAQGVYSYGRGKSVRKRLALNEACIKDLEGELARRKSH